MRDPWVPDTIYDALALRSRPEDKTVEVTYEGEVYATLTSEELNGDANVGQLVRERVRRHYLMVKRPELLVC
jgi:hypothetical protein